MRSVSRSTLVLSTLLALMVVFGQLGRLAAPPRVSAAPCEHRIVTRVSMAEPPLRNILNSALSGVLLFVVIALFREAQQTAAASTAWRFRWAEQSLLARPATRRYMLRV